MLSHSGRARHTVPRSVHDGRPVRIALVGCGVIGAIYRAALDTLPLFELVGVCDSDPTKATTTAAWGAPFFERLDRLIEAAQPEAVVITAPNDRHAELCSQALEAGVSVCCEKPLALAPTDAERLQADARRRGLSLLTAYHRRYNRNFLQLVRARAGRAIRHLEVFYLERIEEHCGLDSWYLQPERVGGGCLADNGPNALDTAMALLGPLTVSACRVRRPAAGPELQATVDLRANDGATVTCVLDWAYQRGELKGVVAHLRDASALRSDFLAGFPAFKSSLDHEYAAILQAFAATLRPAGRGGPSGTPDRERALFPPDGAAVARLVADCYRLERSDSRLQAREVQL